MGSKIHLWQHVAWSHFGTTFVALPSTTVPQIPGGPLIGEQRTITSGGEKKKKNRTDKMYCLFLSFWTQTTHTHRGHRQNTDLQGLTGSALIGWTASTFMSKQPAAMKMRMRMMMMTAIDGVGLENSSLQDLWPNTVVQVHPPPSALCWAEVWQ